MTGEWVGDERAQSDAPRVERSLGEGDIELTEHRLRVGHAEPVESLDLRLGAQLPESPK
jgi:hypothetical protein